MASLQQAASAAAPIDVERLLAYAIPETHQTYDDRDAILYALSAGFGHDPVDEHQLRYVYEDALRVTPTFAGVLGYPGFWLKDPATGVDWTRVVHAEQRQTVHEPIPPRGSVVGHTHVTRVVDKGPGRPALIYVDRRLEDTTGRMLATAEQVVMVRGGGGFGGSDEAPPSDPAPPGGSPDLVCDLPTLPQSALLYRLTGDRNPLHADPTVARIAGFARPILHGMCTYAVAGHAILREVCGYDPVRLRSLSCRFSAPVHPGETIRTEMWLGPEGDVSFRSLVVERGEVVLDRGHATVAPRRP